MAILHRKRTTDAADVWIVHRKLAHVLDRLRVGAFQPPGICSDQA
jgi:hypothetical protein